MLMPENRKRRGFTLTELAMVMGVIGIMIGGIWAYAGSARQTGRVEQAVEAVALTADAVRTAYAGQASISGGVWTVMPVLISTGAMPSSLTRSTASTCSGISTNYADTPWGGAYTSCGTLLVCAWSYVPGGGGSTACGNFIGSQYFAIEFNELDYGSCIALAERVVPTTPRGLMDVYINATSVVAAGTGLPVSPSTAASKCTAHSLTNTVDFIYSLRIPLT
jgi:prepilin-type N-terminal cleavage/methylation domain-containing protein